MTPSSQSSEFDILASGETGRLIASYDWTGTSLGPVDGWPQSLKSIVGFMLRSPVPMALLWGAEGLMLYNDAYSAFAGGRHPELLGSKVREGWPEVSAFNDNVMRVGLAGGTLAYRDQELTLSRNGVPEQVWMNLDFSPVPNDSGAPAGVMAIVIETTERVLAERRAASERERLYRMFKQAPGFICTLGGPRHVFEFANVAYEGLFGQRDYIGKTVREAFPELEGQGFYDLLDGVYVSGERFVANRIPMRFEPPGSAPVERFLDFIFEPITDEAGRVGGIFVEGFDVTAAQQAQEELRKSEERLQLLDHLGEATSVLSDADAIMAATTRIVGEQLGVAICAYADMDPDADGFTIRGDWSAPGSASIVGHYSLAAFGRLAVTNLKAGAPLVVNDNRAELAPEEAATFQSIGIAATICMPLVKDGRLTALMAIHDRVPRLWSENELAVIREVTERSWAHIERVRAEAELRASEANFRTLARAMPNHVWSAAPDGALDWFNDQVYVYSGAEPGALDGSGWTTIVHPEDLPGATARWTEALGSGETYEVEFRLRRSDDAWRWHLARAVPLKEESGRILRWIGTNTDIQDQKEIARQLADVNATLEQRVEERTTRLVQAEEALRQSQKMEAIGQLTGGVAHDFNNLLTVIRSSADLLRRHDLPEEKRRRYIDAISDTADRAARLTGQLLAFARRQSLKAEVFDVAGRVREVADMLRTVLGARIELELEVRDPSPFVEADATQFDTALVNMAVNARDAMAGQGKLTITVEEPQVGVSGDLCASDDLVGVSVSDTGGGVAPGDLQRIFEPFFTTKDVGQGTGLGLSQVYGFAKQSGGDVEVRSEHGAGATFTLYLPRSAAPVALEARKKPASAPRGRGRVLVVEDNDQVREFACQLLEDLGYATREAANADEALLLLESGSEAVDVMFSDVVMPGVGGVELGNLVRERWPAISVVLTSGYSHVLAADARHGFPLLHKPYSVEDLSRILRTARAGGSAMALEAGG